MEGKLLCTTAHKNALGTVLYRNNSGRQAEDKDIPSGRKETVVYPYNVLNTCTVAQNCAPGASSRLPCPLLETPSGRLLPCVIQNPYVFHARSANNTTHGRQARAGTIIQQQMSNVRMYVRGAPTPKYLRAQECEVARYLLYSPLDDLVDIIYIYVPSESPLWIYNVHTDNIIHTTSYTPWERPLCTYNVHAEYSRTTLYTQQQCTQHDTCCTHFLGLVSISYIPSGRLLCTTTLPLCAWGYTASCTTLVHSLLDAGVDTLGGAGVYCSRTFLNVHRVQAARYCCCTHFVTTASISCIPSGRLLCTTECSYTYPEYNIIYTMQAACVGTHFLTLVSIPSGRGATPRRASEPSPPCRGSQSGTGTLLPFGDMSASALGTYSRRDHITRKVG